MILLDLIYQLNKIKLAFKISYSNINQIFKIDTIDRQWQKKLFIINKRADHPNNNN